MIVNLQAVVLADFSAGWKSYVLSKGSWTNRHLFNSNKHKEVILMAESTFDSNALNNSLELLYKKGELENENSTQRN